MLLIFMIMLTTRENFFEKAIIGNIAFISKVMNKMLPTISKRLFSFYSNVYTTVYPVLY